MLARSVALLSVGVFLLAQSGLSYDTNARDLHPPDLSRVAREALYNGEEFVKGKALAEKGELEKALPLLEQAHKKAPNVPEVLFWLGYVRESLHDTSGALRAYQTFV